MCQDAYHHDDKEVMLRDAVAPHRAPVLQLLMVKTHRRPSNTNRLIHAIPVGTHTYTQRTLPLWMTRWFPAGASPLGSAPSMRAFSSDTWSNAINWRCVCLRAMQWKSVCVCKIEASGKTGYGQTPMDAPSQQAQA